MNLFWSAIVRLNGLIRQNAANNLAEVVAQTETFTTETVRSMVPTLFRRYVSPLFSLAQSIFRSHSLFDIFDIIVVRVWQNHLPVTPRPS
jgi:hypothetical protein